MQSWKVRLSLVFTMLAMLLAVSTPAMADDLDLVCEVDDVEWVSGADGVLDTDSDFDGWNDSDFFALVTLDCDEDDVFDDDDDDDWDKDWDENWDEHWDEHWD